MTNGQIDNIKNNKISKRIFLAAYLQDIIKESVYYRTHSTNFSSNEKYVIGNVNEKESKKKLI